MVNEPVDRTEELIREALAHQATQAPHPASIQRNVRPRRHRLLIAGAAVAVAAAVAAGVLLPKLARHAQPNPAAPPSAPQFILLVGLDTRDGGTTMNADTIMLTRLAPDGSSWAASIPRDSFVDIPGQGKHKAGSAYPRAWQAAREHGADPQAAADAGMRALVGAVEQLTGVKIEHYAALRMDGFVALTDAVGGVPVCLRSAAQDPYSGANFPAGRQVLNGQSALAFVRQRHGLRDGDLDRVARQQALLRSLVSRVDQRLSNPDTVRALVNLARTSTQVDPGWDLVSLAEQLRGAHLDRLRVATIPVGTMVHTPDDGDGLAVVPASVAEFVRALDAPAGPGATPTGVPSSPPVPGTDPDCVN